MSQPPLAPDPNTLRVGFISARPLDNPDALSGMPYHMARALRQEGIEIVHISSTPKAKPFQLHLAARYRNNARYTLKRRLDTVAAPLVRALVRRETHRQSRHTQRHLDQLTSGHEPLHAIFGCNISKSLARFQTTLPIIYYSDATAPMILPNYPRFALRGRSYREAIIDAELQGVHRATAAIFASPVARDSAIKDLRIDPDRTHVVPMGAHITPDTPSGIHPPASPPTRQDCQLLIVAADPVRKRADLALHATELLRERLINATLHIVGPGTPRSNASPAANPIGVLKLSNETDRHTHQRLLRECHLQLLPSLGEAFGIAPIESAHFARPSIVSNAGGLPFVVQHNQTGLVIDRDADANSWADAIESLIDAPDHYRALSTAALQRARAELNWNAWGRSVARIIRQTIADHR